MDLNSLHGVMDVSRQSSPKQITLPSFIQGRSAHLKSVFDISAYLGETVCIVVRVKNGTLPYAGMDLLSLNFVSHHL